MTAEKILLDVVMELERRIENERFEVARRIERGHKNIAREHGLRRVELSSILAFINETSKK